MSLIGNTKLRILETLSEESTHGYALHQQLGVTTSTIYQHLDELETAGMVTKQDSSDNPTDRVVYSLTEDGEALLDLLSEKPDE